jgi:histidine kinase/DNA gyrase B/HSP90-like ATPase
MTSLFQDPLLWILLVVVAAAVVAVLRARRINLVLREKTDSLQSRLGASHRETLQLHAHVRTLEDRHSRDMDEVRADAEAGTKTVLKSAVSTLQSLAEEQQVLLDDLLTKYGDSTEVLQDLMSIDHTGAQFSRRAKGISVLCGGWLGRREEPSVAYDVARSAQGRIKDFDRVSINSQVSVSVSSKAVEPVATVLAELLDNATNYSAPGTPVEVNIQSVPTGVCFIVDDAGLGMDQETKERAATLLSVTEAQVDITGLGDPPRFGFAVCGMLAARYGFAVSVGSVSPYGGVRAVVRVPESLLTAGLPEQRPGVLAQRGDGASSGQRLVPVPVLGSPVAGTTAGGLPKRRRRSGQVPPLSVAPVPDPPEGAGVPELDGETTASRLGAFARGTQRGRESNTAEGTEDK